MATRNTQNTKTVIAAMFPVPIVTQVTRVIIATAVTTPPYTPQGLLLKGLGS